ncbi:hypothetical protein K7957_05160 [Sphingomonas yunnanensis]|uniref:hypothetical protein n=1 Tax=Sphingomonas yunnanensis TaxID=310400 RepID=UPI001CA61126|nr:hypothetical protein [Sphingomonas yunnanensis]MBY9062318.1 hypothetical protein [Sphingomonas yunnanensis]
MTDQIDMAAEIEAEHVALGLARARVSVPVGAAGDCNECGHYMPRLVGGRCGFCRDGRLPPDSWEPPQRPGDLPPRTPTMKAKNLQLPAFAEEAIAAVEALAEREDLSLGHAAAKLIEAGQAAAEGSTAASADEPRGAVQINLGALTLTELVDELRRRVEEVIDQDELAAANARAVSAETQLADLTAKVKALAS